MRHPGLFERVVRMSLWHPQFRMSWQLLDASPFGSYTCGPLCVPPPDRRKGRKAVDGMTSGLAKRSHRAVRTLP